MRLMTFLTLLSPGRISSLSFSIPRIDDQRLELNGQLLSLLLRSWRTAFQVRAQLVLGVGECAL
jgi:hypothetical protein